MTPHHAIVSKHELTDQNSHKFWWDCLRRFIVSDQRSSEYYRPFPRVHENVVLLWESDFDRLVKTLDKIATDKAANVKG